MKKRDRAVLLGNEAIALGLIEGGCQIITGYPGTPSSEILPAAIDWSKRWNLPLYSEWSTNEKVAFDQAYSAAIVGKRAACCMKQVGLNVACDSLLSSAYTGILGGMVIVSCDDPGPHSSQTEQDSRRMAWLAKTPVLDPVSPGDARTMARESLEVSQRFGIPVILRSVTRLSHARQDMDLPRGLQNRGELPKATFQRNPSRWAATPRFRLLLHKELNRKLRKLESVAERYASTNIPSLSTVRSPLGIIASGIPSVVAREILQGLGLNELPILTLRMPFPFPRKITRMFLESCDKVLVLEEPDAFIEVLLQERRTVWGRQTGHVPLQGELLPEVVEGAILRALADAGMRRAPRIPKRRAQLLQAALDEASLPRRPPRLCPGCPHRASFFAIKKAFPKAIYPSDIGCYTLGTNLGVVDTVLDMGSGITIASGLYQAFKLDGVDQPIVATMGDSTFYHSGTPGLINAVHNGSRFILVLLDNGVTAMTGMQSTPAWDGKADGSPARSIPLERVVAGCGVDFIEVCDPYDVRGMEESLKRAWEYVAAPHGSVAVVIARHPCLLHRPMARGEGKKLLVLTDRCKGCRYCLDAFECPALCWDEATQRVMINQGACVGCGVCVFVCPTGAITPQGRH